MRFTSTLFFVILISIAARAQKTMLRLNLQEGKTYKHLSTAKSTVVQEVNGQEINMTMDIQGSMSFLVKKVNNDSYDMDVQYDSLSVGMELPQNSVNFSSEKNDTTDAFSSMLAALKNKVFTIQMDRAGKVIQVKGIEQLFAEAFEKYPQIPGQQREQIKSQMEKAYGADALKGSIEMVTAIFSGHPVAPGENWTINTKLETGMSANLTSVYTFVEKNDKFILIKGDCKLQTADKDAYMETNGMAMKYDMTGTIKSEIRIDPNSGWIIQSVLSEQISGDAFIKENDQLPDGMKIPVSIKTEISMRGR
jgi:hypothetical protein